MNPVSGDGLATQLMSLLADEILAEDEEFGPATDLLRSGLLDSMGVVQVVDWLEVRLSIEIDPADVTIEHFRSVDTILAYVDRRLGGLEA
jgi:acyl carrier protein